MKQNNPYIILAKATISYIWKNHPYMLACVISGIISGIYMAITELDATKLISGIIIGFSPMIIKKIGIAILSLDSSERIGFWKAKMYRREKYKNYVKEYVEKLMEDQD